MNEAATMPNAQRPSADEQHDVAPERVIRRRVQEVLNAIRAKDLHAVMSIYAPDVVSFDLMPPLQYTGVEAKRRAWQEAFSAYVGSIDYDIGDLTVTASGDLAFVRSINHVRATGVDGRLTALRVRWTACFRRFDALWLIVHDHVSIPADSKGAAAVGLARTGADSFSSASVWCA